MVMSVFPFVTLIMTTVLSVMAVSVLFCLNKYIKLKTEILKQELEKSKSAGN